MTSHWRVCRAGCGANPTQETLRKNHGTPAEFSAAVWRAQGDGFVTAEEAARGIREYENEWSNAPSRT